LQVVIEDYVHHRPTEIGLQLIVAIATLVGAVVGILSILKVAFGA
jgi:succinate dehydrogenase hydrophobic anchor subunit